MFSALKKITGNRNGNGTNGDVNGSASTPGDLLSPSMHAMPASLQKKFSRGVHYNMKLLLRGDRASGKTTLFKRLQGDKFSEEYEQSEEISVSAIQWNHKATDDIVKVDVWDVVDKGKKRIKLDGLKLTAETNGGKSGANGFDACLDAEFLDVYQGAHGVIFLFDVTKAWTFEYLTREVPKVPPHIPVLVLANFIDKAHHRVVTREQALGFIEHLEDRDNDNVRYAESSMRNGFGLRFLHKFLSLPYLTLQRQSLLQQLERNEREMAAMAMELDLYLQSEDSDYERFSSSATDARRRKAEREAPAPTVDVVVGQLSNSVQVQKDQRVPLSDAVATAALPSIKTPSPRPSPTPISSTTTTTAATTAATTTAATAASTATASPSSNANSSFPIMASNSMKSHPSPSKRDIDLFVPDVDGIDSFLEDTSEGSKSNRSKLDGGAGGGGGDDTSDDDDDCANPMVAKISEDLSDDETGDVGSATTLYESF